MNRLAGGSLIFLAGWGLGWYAHKDSGTDPTQSARSLITAPSTSVVPEAPAADFAPAASESVDRLVELLQRNQFDAAVDHYESLQVQSGEVAVADARVRVLARARRLIRERRFSLAEQLLQRFLVAAYRDVEARILLAEAYRGQHSFRAAIDQLYEARGYAFRPMMLQQITDRIRNLVAEQAQLLKRNNDKNALLVLYQFLTQMEPDHAPYFMALASTQLALDDKAGARRSLQLVLQDPDVGAQAQAMLAKLGSESDQTRDAEPPASATEVAGIPLHRSGNNFLVDAKAARGRNIRLLIDTGASLTIFTPDVLEQRGIRYRDTGRTGVFNTANGPVRAPIYNLDTLSVGDWKVSQLDIGVLDLEGHSGINGLLGMNFLSHFQFFIDQNEALLRLSIN